MTAPLPGYAGRAASTDPVAALGAGGPSGGPSLSSLADRDGSGASFGELVRQRLDDSAGAARRPVAPDRSGSSDRSDRGRDVRDGGAPQAPSVRRVVDRRPARLADQAGPAQRDAAGTDDPRGLVGDPTARDRDPSDATGSTGSTGWTGSTGSAGLADGAAGTAGAATPAPTATPAPSPTAPLTPTPLAVAVSGLPVPVLAVGAPSRQTAPSAGGTPGTDATTSVTAATGATTVDALGPAGAASASSSAGAAFRPSFGRSAVAATTTRAALGGATPTAAQTTATTTTTATATAGTTATVAADLPTAGPGRVLGQAPARATTASTVGTAEHGTRTTGPAVPGSPAATPATPTTPPATPATTPAAVAPSSTATTAAAAPPATATTPRPDDGHESDPTSPATGAPGSPTVPTTAVPGTASEHRDPATAPDTGTATVAVTATPAPTSAATPVTATPTPVVGTPAGTSAEAAREAVRAQVLPEVARLVPSGDGVQRVVLQLNPRALGEVRVVLTMRRGELTVRLAAGDQARAALLDSSSDLQRLLEQGGARSVVLDVRDQQGTSSGQPQQRQDQTAQSWTAGADHPDSRASSAPRQDTTDHHGPRTGSGHPATDGTTRTTSEVSRPPSRPAVPVLQGLDLTL